MSTTDPAKLDPVALMSSFVLEDGRRWGSAAYPFQLDDARAILDPDGPRRHFILRGRGMSKTTDVAGLALALLLTEAPRNSRSYVFAADSEQASLTRDALQGLADRSGLIPLLDVGARSVTVKATGARLDIMSSDGASAYGLRPWLCIVDELPMWPSTGNYRNLWAAIISSIGKVPGARLVVIGTAGPPVGLGHDVHDLAAASPQHWRAVTEPGPSPWWTAEDTAATRASLTASEWRRLILCQWAEGDDSLTDPAAVADAIRPGDPAIPYRPGRRYIITLDIGTRRDLTACAVSHTERTDAGRVVIVDRVMSWRPSHQSGGRVDLDEVQDAVARLARTYRAPVHFDRMMAEQLTTNLTRDGVVCHEYVFSSAGANRLARALYIALRDRALSLPDDPELVDGFTSTRMIETTPGTVKLHNPAGHHDDIPTVVGMAVAVLTERPDSGRSTLLVPTTRHRPDLDRRPTRVVLAATRHHRTGPNPGDALTALQGLPGRPVVRRRPNPFERGRNS